MTRPDTTARRLLDNRTAGQPIANADWHASGLAPAHQAAGYAAQDAMTAILTELGDTVIGYKIGATNQTARDLLGVSSPFYGRLYDISSVETPGEMDLIEAVHKVAEPEVAIRLGQDLDPSGGPFDAATIEAATQSLHPAIEIITSPFDPWMEAGAPTLIADNGAHGAWVVGEAITDWSGFDPLEGLIHVQVSGMELLTGKGGAVDGGAFGAAAWLANKLAEQGRGLKAGDYVSTGTVTPPIKLVRGQRIEAAFGPLGTVSLTVSS